MNAPNFSQLLRDIREVHEDERQIAANNAQANLLIRREHTARGRRFDGMPITGFGDISTVGSDRWREVRDEEEACDREDQRRERLERGE